MFVLLKLDLHSTQRQSDFKALQAFIGTEKRRKLLVIMQNCQRGGDILSYSSKYQALALGGGEVTGCHFWFKVLALVDRNGIQPL